MRIHKGDLGKLIHVCRNCLSLWTHFDDQDKCVCGGDDWFRYKPDDDWNEDEGDE